MKVCPKSAPKRACLEASFELGTLQVCVGQAHSCLVVLLYLDDLIHSVSEASGFSCLTPAVLLVAGCARVRGSSVHGGFYPCFSVASPVLAASWVLVLRGGFYY